MFMNLRLLASITVSSVLATSAFATHSVSAQFFNPLAVAKKNKTEVVKNQKYTNFSGTWRGKCNISSEEIELVLANDAENFDMTMGDQSEHFEIGKNIQSFIDKDNSIDREEIVNMVVNWDANGSKLHIRGIDIDREKKNVDRSLVDVSFSLINNMTLKYDMNFYQLIAGDNSIKPAYIGCELHKIK